MKFGDILKGAAAEGKEKHVPVIERNGNDVTVTVGKETPHPSTMEHHIDWIELFGVTKDDKVIDLGRAYFAPTYTTPTARFTIPADGFKALYSVSYCNIHGVWESSMAL